MRAVKYQNTSDNPSGAARTVTGSCYLFQTRSGSFLVDCGLFQGPKTLKALNYGAFPLRAADIHAVLLTHAHIDHSGLLPKLTAIATRTGDDGSVGELCLSAHLIYPFTLNGLVLFTALG